jgi:hypothetical protein
VLPIVASLLAVTLFWVQARDLFGFDLMIGIRTAVPPLAGLGGLLALEVLWRLVRNDPAYLDCCLQDY